MIHNRHHRVALPELRVATRFDTIPIEPPWSRGLSSALPITTPRRTTRKRTSLPLTPLPALPS